MFIIGWVMLLVSAVTAVCVFEEDEARIQAKIIVVFFIVLSIALLCFDFFSPTYIKSEKTFITNDYQKYELNIENKKLGVVKEIAYKSLYPLAIVNNETKYIFIDFTEGE